MRKSVISTLATYGLYPHEYSNILFCAVADKDQGITIAKEILYAIVDMKTMVYLSGGSTPKPLYEQLAKEEKFSPGAIGLIDERYGEVMHEHSNEKMIFQTGLLRYLKLLNFPYYSILHGLSIEETAERYDQLVRSLLTVYSKTVGILGIGADGHTAGIAPNRSDFENPLFEKSHACSMVDWFDDSNGTFKKRVTMTFLGLSMLDVYILLVFGKEKVQALRSMFEQGKEEEVPARFFLRPEIAKKTVVITDQTLY